MVEYRHLRVGMAYSPLYKTEEQKRDNARHYPFSLSRKAE